VYDGDIEMITLFVAFSPKGARFHSLGRSPRNHAANEPKPQRGATGFLLTAVVAFLFLAIPSTSLKVGLSFNAHGSKRHGEFHCFSPINLNLRLDRDYS
jgi:hypothetical protein